MRFLFLVLAAVFLFSAFVDSQTKKPAATTTPAAVDPVDSITDKIFNWLFSYFPKKSVKALVNRLLTVVCDNQTDVTEIQRDLATQALLNGTVAQLTPIQGDLANATAILGADYQIKIATFMNNIFEPFLAELPDIAATNFTSVKTCKSSVADEINQLLTINSTSDALINGLATLQPTKICIDLFPFIKNYFTFSFHNITQAKCGGATVG